MFKTKPWSPLSLILRRALSSSTSHLVRPSIFRLFASRSTVDIFRVSRCRGYDYFKFSGIYWYSRSVANDVDLKCWNCDSVVPNSPFLVCKSCRSIQPVDHSVDFFQIFGLERTYEIQVECLEGKYKDWQKQLHPDLVHTKSEREREYASEQSARVIDAYGTLRKALSRAIYILKLEGVDVDEEETLSDLELLSEIMEIREAVEEAADDQALTQIQSQMQDNLQHWSKSFAIAFKCQKFDEAINCIRRMTYYERVNEEIVKRL